MIKNFKRLFFCLNLLSISYLQGQKSNTSGTDTAYLPEITLVGASSDRDLIKLPDVVETRIYAGKKNSLIVLDNLNSVVVNNTMRQILGKVPGIHIWESDGSGIQIGIAARGLSPNRSWEFNIRQDGADIAADPYGYPEAYYNPQLQAVQRIQIVRGAGALQYGPQFGGMVNYIMRDGSEIHKPFQVESRQTVGSYGLLNSFNAIGGNTGKFRFYAFYDTRSARGWRANSQYRTQTAFASLSWQITKSLKIKTEYTGYTMISQQPGGIKDAELEQDAQNSHRSRNWFNTPWNIGLIKLDWDINSNNRIQLKISGNYADRNSVGFMQAITVADTLVTATRAYNSREVAIDRYRNIMAEADWLHTYSLGGVKQTFSMGIRAFKSLTHRMSKGKGTTGTDADFSITESAFPADARFNSMNQALFAENSFHAGKRWIFVPGIRTERVSAISEGRLGFSGSTEQLMRPENKTRFFTLFGLGIEFHLNKSLELYGNLTQAYRPILFSNLANPGTDVLDPNLKDSRGYNADLGIRGQIGKYISLDFGSYYLKYNNRVGTLSALNSGGQIYRFITNVGASQSYGIEMLLEADPLSKLFRNIMHGHGSFPFYINYTLNRSYYQDFKVHSVSGTTITETNLKGKQVENAPQNLLRAGIGYKGTKLAANIQFNFTDKSFTDAQNTLQASANGQNGLIAAYQIWDLCISYKITHAVAIKTAVNNLFDTRYATRRAGGYPGPGLMPGEGRTLLCTLSAAF